MHNILPLVLEVPDLNQYFPKLQPNQLLDRDYMYSILAIFRNDKLKKVNTECKEE